MFFSSRQNSMDQLQFRITQRRPVPTTFTFITDITAGRTRYGGVGETLAPS